MKYGDWVRMSLFIYPVFANGGNVTPQLQGYLQLVHNKIDILAMNLRMHKMKIEHFNDLEGIVFGIRTAYSDKIKIAEIIQEKCKEFNRSAFDFYEMIYDGQNGKLRPVHTVVNF